MNPEQNAACETLYQAFTENTDTLAFEELSTNELIALQTLLNEMLVKRFKALHQGVKALHNLEAETFNSIAR